MRLYKKYKNWLKLSLNFFPLRIFKFKRSKWKKLKSPRILRKLKRKILFSDLFCIEVSLRTWERIKKFQKLKIINKNKTRSRFDFSISSFKNKKLKVLDNSKQNLIINKIFRKEYRVDVLLWKLHFFSSVYKARQYINAGFVFKNGLLLKHGSAILKYGDVIAVDSRYFLDNNFLIKKNLKTEMYFSFVEVDYYTLSFVILKGLEQLNKFDLQNYLQDTCPLSFLREF